MKEIIVNRAEKRLQVKFHCDFSVVDPAFKSVKASVEDYLKYISDQQNYQNEIEFFNDADIVKKLKSFAEYQLTDQDRADLLQLIVDDYKKDHPQYDTSILRLVEGGMEDYRGVCGYIDEIIGLDWAVKKFNFDQDDFMYVYSCNWE